MTESLCKPTQIPNKPSVTNTVHPRSGSGIFKSSNPAQLARAIVIATTNYNDANILAECSTGLGPGMKGEGNLNKTEKMADRGC